MTARRRPPKEPGSKKPVSREPISKETTEPENGVHQYRVALEQLNSEIDVVVERVLDTPTKRVEEFGARTEARIDMLTDVLRVTRTSSVSASTAFNKSSAEFVKMSRVRLGVQAEGARTAGDGRRATAGILSLERPRRLPENPHRNYGKSTSPVRPLHRDPRCRRSTPSQSPSLRSTAPTLLEQPRRRHQRPARRLVHRPRRALVVRFGGPASWARGSRVTWV